MIDQDALAKLETSLSNLYAGLTELHQHAKKEYARLVALPYSSPSRAYSQPYMAFLRDFIALAEERESEDVQSEYEANASLSHALRDGRGALNG